MARRLFEEWFVRFRYPGGEGANIVESSLGPIPSDWNVEKLEVLCERITDGSHWSPPTTAPGRFMASVKDMREWGFDLSSCRRICEEDFENLIRNDCQPRVGDILVAKDGANLNKHTFLVTEQLDLVVLSSVAIIRPKPEVPGEFLVGLLRSDAVSERIKRSASGAAIPRIVLKDFRRLEIVSPPDKIRRLWALRSAPLHELCRKLTGQNTRLRAARDLLLPKLISGEIDVSAAPAPDDAARDAA